MTLYRDQSIIKKIPKEELYVEIGLRYLEHYLLHTDSKDGVFNLVVLTGGGWESSILAEMLIAATAHPRFKEMLEELDYVVFNLNFLHVNYGQISFKSENRAVDKVITACVSKYHLDRPSRVNIAIIGGETSFLKTINPECFLLTGNPEHDTYLKGRNHFLAYFALAGVLHTHLLMFGVETIAKDVKGFEDCTPEFMCELSLELGVDIAHPLKYFEDVKDYETMIEGMDKDIISQFFSCYSPLDDDYLGLECGKCAHCVKSKEVRARFNLEKRIDIRTVN